MEIFPLSRLIFVENLKSIRLSLFELEFFFNFRPPKNIANNFSNYLKNNRVLYFTIADFWWKFQVDRIFLSWDIVFTTFVTDYIHTYRQTDFFKSTLNLFLNCKNFCSLAFFKNFKNGRVNAIYSSFAPSAAKSIIRKMVRWQMLCFKSLQSALFTYKFIRIKKNNNFFFVYIH